MDKTSKLFDVWAKTGRSEEMEKGYKLNDKVVRPSRVVVSKAIEEK